MSNLFSVSVPLGSERKALVPSAGSFGTGNSAARLAPSGSMAVLVPVLPVKMLVGTPAVVVPIGTPQYPLGLALAGPVPVCARRELKISPGYVGLPLQSRNPVAVLEFRTGRNEEKSPLTSAGVGTVDTCGSP